MTARTSNVPTLNNEMAMEQQRAMCLQAQLAERQRAASSYDNPGATGDHLTRVQQAAAQQAQLTPGT